MILVRAQCARSLDRVKINLIPRLISEADSLRLYHRLPVDGQVNEICRLNFHEITRQDSGTERMYDVSQ